jgi:hypothetical protein
MILTKQLTAGILALLIFMSSATSAFAEQSGPEHTNKLAEIKKKISSTNDNTRVTVTLSTRRY